MILGKSKLAVWLWICLGVGSFFADCKLVGFGRQGFCRDTSRYTRIRLGEIGKFVSCARVSLCGSLFFFARSLLSSCCWPCCWVARVWERSFRWNLEKLYASLCSNVSCSHLKWTLSCSSDNCMREATEIFFWRGLLARPNLERKRHMVACCMTVLSSWKVCFALRLWRRLLHLVMESWAAMESLS